jgi:hypothetical protein
MSAIIIIYFKGVQIVHIILHCYIVTYRVSLKGANNSMRKQSANTPKQAPSPLNKRQQV